MNSNPRKRVAPGALVPASPACNGHADFNGGNTENLAGLAALKDLFLAASCASADVSQPAAGNGEVERCTWLLAWL